MTEMGLPVQRWLREPLLHFLIAGMALFGAYRVLSPAGDLAGRSTRIEVTADDLRQLEMGWRSQWQRAPTTVEMRNLVETRIREEILYREALALGLDKDDTIVKRRLAQKLEFLAEDVSTIRDPTGAELEAWFEKKRDRFSLPGLVSFRHLYFSPDRRGEQARAGAVKALSALAGKPVNTPATGLADRFMAQDYYAYRDPEGVANVFGTQFAQALLQLKPGRWQGPIESGLGWHVVFVESIGAGRVPDFEEIEPAVKAEWLAEQRADLKRKAFESMRLRYEIVISGPPAEVGARKQ